MTAGNEHGITADVVYQRALTEFDDVGAEELGIVYQRMLHDADPDGAKRRGVYYTPQEVAEFMAGFSLRVGLRSVGPEPEQVMRIKAIEPACGSGILLVWAGRMLAREYASRLVGGREPSGDLMLAVLPRVFLECVFGVDIDPVAVDLARLAVSLETVGAVTPAMLDRHIVVGNVLDGDLPPAYPVPNPPGSFGTEP